MTLNNASDLSHLILGSFGNIKTPYITAISGCNIGCEFCKCLIIKLICGQAGFSDRKLLYPTSRQVRLSENGLGLLREMMIPIIEVNSFRNTIATVDGSEVQLRINDVEATVQDIMALRPDDVKRIEYLDNPGLRYGNAEVVLNYIVKRRQSGGNFSTDIMQGVTAKWANYQMSGKINWRKSEFNLSAFSSVSDTKSIIGDK